MILFVACRKTGIGKQACPYVGVNYEKSENLDSFKPEKKRPIYLPLYIQLHQIAEND